jgi:hypothetical protein
MINKIIQSHPDKGTREFELVDDTIDYKISGPMGDEELSVVLSVLSPEPVRDDAMLYFVSEVNREALIKLFVDLPDADTFTSFVSTLQQRITEEDFGKLAAENRKSDITRDQVQTTIRMLENNMDASSIDELLATLKDLVEAPNDREQLDKVVNAFHALGMQQGPVLTYAPFFNTLMSTTDVNDLP